MLFSFSFLNVSLTTITVDQWQEDCKLRQRNTYKRHRNNLINIINILLFCRCVLVCSAMLAVIWCHKTDHKISVIVLISNSLYFLFKLSTTALLCLFWNWVPFTNLQLLTLRMSKAAAVPLSLLRQARITLAPLLARARAVDFPMPVLLPMQESHSDKLTIILEDRIQRSDILETSTSNHLKTMHVKCLKSSRWKFTGTRWVKQSPPSFWLQTKVSFSTLLQINSVMMNSCSLYEMLHSFWWIVFMFLSEGTLFKLLDFQQKPYRLIKLLVWRHSCR